MDFQLLYQEFVPIWRRTVGSLVTLFRTLNMNMWLFLKGVPTLLRDEFIAKALRVLQLQIDGLKELTEAQEKRIHVLERQNMWNLAQGNIEQSPLDTFIVRLAYGKLGLNLMDNGEVFIREEIVDDTTD